MVHPIETEALTKLYRGAVGCRDVSLTVRAGELFGLLGPNGAGKSTIMKLLTGLLRPTAGSARLAGMPARDPRPRRLIGYLPEGFRYHRWLTGAEVLRLHASLCGLKGAKRDSAVDRKLDLVGLAAVRGRKVATYSRGMQQRLGLAAALLPDPRILFLDEPSAALDPLGRREVRNLLLDLKKRGVTVFLNSHLLGEVEMICDTVAFMKDGSIEASGSLSGFLAETEVLEVVMRPRRPEILRRLAVFGEMESRGERVLLKMRDPNRIPEVARLIVDSGADLLRLAPRTGTLEELFVSLMSEGGRDAEHLSTHRQGDLS